MLQVDGLIRVLSYIGVALPAFVIGILLLLLFGYKLQAIPVLGRLSTTLVAPKTVTGFFVLDALLAGDFTVAWDAFLHLLLPALALAVPPMVQDARILRSSLVRSVPRKGLYRRYVPMAEELLGVYRSCSDR